MTNECRKWLEQQGNEFMQPFADFFSDAMARLCVDGLEDTRADLAGWYSRLSAPGYLDCTDWIGPFDTEDEAFESLYETYGND
jgi:hypothetical protein